jgi:uncharacterized protein (DUF1501 family)
MKISRRNFVKSGLSGLTYLSCASTVPLWLSKSAEAICNDDSNRILVIVQQSGGNDGLNTVIPYTDPYYTGSQLIDGDEVRPNMKILEPDLALTKLGDGLNALHPKWIRLKDWYDNGNMAVIQNVGYPNPNLSHFIATDLWELGTSPSSQLSTLMGWGARFFDNQCQGAPDLDALKMMIAGKSSVPLTLRGSTNYTAPAVKSFEDYELSLPSNEDLGPHRLEYINRVNSFPVVDSSIDFLQRSANVAQVSVQNVADASLAPELNPYLDTKLGNGLNIASKVIRSGFGTRVFYVEQTGYDTHSNQIDLADPINVGDHPRLLDEFDQSLDSFLKDMEASGNLDRVLVMTFTEFGRRVEENGSQGTDHGAGNSLCVFGGGLNGGVYGGQPDFTDLIKGNLKHTIDFRSVYSTVIRDWFNGDPEAVFGSADFNDPIFDIQGGMERSPFVYVEQPPQVPVGSALGKMAAAALTLAAGAVAVRGLREDESSPEV